ncbi:hypothetical protein Pmi06nite_58330 [Planotetraspora mira]|uniref:Uncharacterized protein n=1 Tax=Planotetraspora mira TaxID=58121 RepID=A0A8J3X9G4_9ACTN|nr:hypothetical protein Pmi06nite_58330 [Planotetraspora mira]
MLSARLGEERDERDHGEKHGEQRVGDQRAGPDPRHDAGGLTRLHGLKYVARPLGMPPLEEGSSVVRRPAPAVPPPSPQTPVRRRPIGGGRLDSLPLRREPGRVAPPDGGGKSWRAQGIRQPWPTVYVPRVGIPPMTCESRATTAFAPARHPLGGPYIDQF